MRGRGDFFRILVPEDEADLVVAGRTICMKRDVDEQLATFCARPETRRGEPLLRCHDLVVWRKNLGVDVEARPFFPGVRGRDREVLGFRVEIHSFAAAEDSVGARLVAAVALRGPYDEHEGIEFE